MKNAHKYINYGERTSKTAKPVPLSVPYRACKSKKRWESEFGHDANSLATLTRFRCTLIFLYTRHFVIILHDAKLLSDFVCFSLPLDFSLYSTHL